MKTSSKLWLASSLAATLVGLAGCSGSNDSGNGSASGASSPGGTQGASEAASVPDSAGSTVAAFMAYMIGMDPNDEKSEPLLMKESFVVPADESSESQPLS